MYTNDSKARRNNNNNGFNFPPSSNNSTPPQSPNRRTIIGNKQRKPCSHIVFGIACGISFLSGLLNYFVKFDQDCFPLTTAASHESMLLQFKSLATTKTKTAMVDSHSDDDNRKLSSKYGTVLEWDVAAMQYAHLSFEGRATLTWLSSSGSQSKAAQASQIRATPMLATIDRRSRQQAKRKACSVVSFVALSHTAELQFHRLKPPSDLSIQPTCAVCYQWANHLVAQQHIIDLARTMNRNASVYRPNDLGTEDTTVCVTGKATFTERQRWRSAYWHFSRNERYKMGRQEDERDTAHGFVWGLWCELPEAQNPAHVVTFSNLLSTSCQNLHPTSWSHELQRVYYTSSFTLQTRPKIGGGSSFRVDAQWPWRALVFDEQAYDPPPNLPAPQQPTDVQLLWAEGPLWSREDFGPDKNRLRWNMSFAATLKRSAPSGIGERFLLSILQQATIAPKSTRLLGVVDSHAKPTHHALEQLLQQPINSWLPWCNLSKDESHFYEPLTLVYLRHCVTTATVANINHQNDDDVGMTLGELLEHRQIRIKVIPFPIRPSLFGTVRQMGQHAFSTWMGVRFSPEYHVIMYMDADAIPFIYPKTHGFRQRTTQSGGSLQDVIYRRMFAAANPCVNQRLEALEYAVKQKAVSSELACANQLLIDPVVLNRTVTYCTKFIGHVLARTDSLGMLWIHDNYASAQLDDLAPGTRVCPDEDDIEDGEGGNGNFDLMFPPDQVVEVHMRSRGRQGQGHRCTCVVEAPT